MPSPLLRENLASGDAALSSLRLLLSHLVASVRGALAKARPWTELIDRSAFSRPQSLSEAASRARKNFSYFRANYAVALATVVAASLLSHPFSFLLLASLGASWLFLYVWRGSDQPLVVGGRTFSDRETLAMLCFATVVVMFLTSVGSLLMSAGAAGLMGVVVHGVFRAPEDLFLEEEEPLGSGLLSFLNASANSAV